MEGMRLPQERIQNSWVQLQLFSPMRIKASNSHEQIDNTLNISNLEREREYKTATPRMYITIRSLKDNT